MLEAIPKNIFSTRFQFQQKNELLGELDNSIWREKARVELKDGTYVLYREGRFSGYFLIEHNGRLVARASKPSALRNTFEVEVAGRQLVLRQLSIWKRRFGLFNGDKQIGSIYPLRVVSRHAHIDVPADLPLPIQVFLFWLVFIVWKRQSQAAA
ncbi:MAG: hypothetical protein H7Z74_07705 [Anaerolineae bacterium]|nr:hypothetical protein [Gemmatimonadaceae bacterium]